MITGALAARRHFWSLLYFRSPRLRLRLARFYDLLASPAPAARPVLRSARLACACGSPGSTIRSPRLRLRLARFYDPLASPAPAARPVLRSARLACGCGSPGSKIRSPRLRLRLALHHRPDDPGSELLFADTGQLAL